MERLRRVQFSQPQDRIYGILGIASDKEKLGIKVRIGTDCATVFTDAAEKIINSTVTDEQSVEGINFLSLVNPAGTTGLPSWVPDLTSLGSFETLAKATTALATPYHASAGTTHVPRQLAAHGRLSCRGILVDKINEIGSPWETDSTGEKWLEGGLAALSSMEEFADTSRVIIVTSSSSKHLFRNRPERLEEAKWRVPILNRESVSSTGTAREATSEWSKTGWEMIKYTMTYALHVHNIWKVISDVPLTADERARLSLFDESERPLEEAKLKMMKNKSFHERAEHSTYQVLLDAFKERRPFLGKHGSVGIGPLTMKPGDLVCVLPWWIIPIHLAEDG